jgi:hypothetical protein
MSSTNPVRRADYVKERTCELGLKLHGKPSDHPEIEEGQSAIRHHSQIAGMRVGVEEAVFEQLLQVGAREKPHHFRRVVAGSRELLDVGHLEPIYELHHDDSTSRQLVMNPRHVDFLPPCEVLLEDLCVACLLLVIQLFKDVGTELVKRPLPVDSADKIRIALAYPHDASQNRDVELDLAGNIRPLYFDSNHLTRS